MTCKKPLLANSYNKYLNQFFPDTVTFTYTITRCVDDLVARDMIQVANGREGGMPLAPIDVAIPSFQRLGQRSRRVIGGVSDKIP